MYTIKNKILKIIEFFNNRYLVLIVLERDVQIKQVREHWEVYVGGDFFCSADSYLEAVNEYYEHC